MPEAPPSPVVMIKNVFRQNFVSWEAKICPPSTPVKNHSPQASIRPPRVAPREMPAHTGTKEYKQERSEQTVHNTKTKKYK